jgi:ankyrin repeat protein
MTSLLLANNANVNLQAYDGRTAIMNAAEADNLEKVRLLLRAGADMNLGADSQRSTLISAIQTRDVDLVKYLFAASNNGAPAPSLNVALPYAIRSGGTEMVRFLLDKGADPRAVGKDWGMPL